MPLPICQYPIIKSRVRTLSFVLILPSWKRRKFAPYADIGKRCNFFELKKGILPTRYLKQNSKSVPTLQTLLLDEIGSVPARRTLLFDEIESVPARRTLLFDEIGSVPTRRSNANLKIRKFAP